MHQNKKKQTSWCTVKEAKGLKLAAQEIHNASNKKNNWVHQQGAQRNQIATSGHVKCIKTKKKQICI